MRFFTLKKQTTFTTLYHPPRPIFRRFPMRLPPFFFILLLLAGTLPACQQGTQPEATPPPAVTTATARPSNTPQPTQSPISNLPSPTPPPTATQPITDSLPLETVEPPDLAYLQEAIEAELAGFDGLSSYVVVDLQTGQRIERESNLAIAGMSLVKIAILLETYRVLDGPPAVAQTHLITETASLSSNYSSNLLLELIAGQPDSFAGAQLLTQSLRRLGLFNTFIAVPYDELARPGYLSSYLTPANQRTDLTTYPDPNMQTTTGDLATLLTHIYTCAENGTGRLLETYPDELTPAECQAIFEAMQLNQIDALIEEGLPAAIPIAHKHGWIGDTHGDAAVIFSPSADYVLVIALHQPEWLEWETSAPLMAELSRLAYAHFNDPLAYSAETLANQPPAAPTATPAANTAIVFGTQGIGVTLRATPGGAEIVVLPEGTLVTLLEAEPVPANGFTWQLVQTPAGEQGWLAAEFLEITGNE
jgi:beta-lactamase class A